jgi:hypothetical protein
VRRCRLKSERAAALAGLILSMASKLSLGRKPTVDEEGDA